MSQPEELEKNIHNVRRIERSSEKKGRLPINQKHAANTFVLTVMLFFLLLWWWIFEVNCFLRATTFFSIGIFSVLNLCMINKRFSTPSGLQITNNDLLCSNWWNKDSMKLIWGTNRHTFTHTHSTEKKATSTDERDDDDDIRIENEILNWYVARGRGGG